MATAHGSKLAVWMQRLCSGIGFEKKSMNINCDNQSTIFMEKNPTYHSENKHSDVQYHFIRDKVEGNKVLLEKLGMLENIEDFLTKSVSAMKFSWCREAMGNAAPGL
jgi:hypothetical protein